MASRVTRSKSRQPAVTLKEELAEEGQTQIKDFFKNTRRTRGPVKNVKTVSEMPSQSLATVRSKARTNRAIPSPPKIKREESPQAETQPLPAIAESPQKQTSPIKPIARKLFAKKPEATVSTSLPVASTEDVTIRSDSLIAKLTKAAGARKATKSKIRSVQELQSKLADKGLARELHTQNIAQKERRVLESLEVLHKSPHKSIVAHHSPRKQLFNPIKKSDVPSYVLPSSKDHRTPAKEKELSPEEDRRGPLDYGKTALLIPAVKDSVKVPLPATYSTLHQLFEHCDRVLSIFVQQGKRTALEEVQQNVRRNVKRDLTIHHIAQMVHLYPTAYSVNIEQKWLAFGGVQKGKWEHVIKPNLQQDLTGWWREEETTVKEEGPVMCVPTALCSPTKAPRSPKKALFRPQPRECAPDGRMRLEGWRMTCRAHVFRYKLTELVKKAHEAFLRKLGLEVSPGKWRRFHPSFDLETCPAVAEEELPQAPVDKEKQSRAMADYMKKLEEEQAVASLPTHVKTVIGELLSPVKATTSASTGVHLSPKKFAEATQKSGSQNSLAGLIERVRAKEAARKLADMNRNPVVERKKGRIERLLSTHLRCICSLYAFNKARSMEISRVIDRVLINDAMLGRAEATAHLEVLCEASPAHFTMCNVVGKKYLQLRDNDYDVIVADLKQEMAALG